jgi:hypothetical protein
MTSLQEFRCEVCGLLTTNPIHWFVIRCGESELTVYRWNAETANAAGARHTAVKLTPRCTSVAGLSRCARRPSQVSNSAPTVSDRCAIDDRVTAWVAKSCSDPNALASNLQEEVLCKLLSFPL